MAEVLRVLIPRLLNCLSPDVHDHALKGNLMTPPDILMHYCSRVIATQAKTRKKAKKKVPGKLKLSSMLLKEEYAFIIKQFRPLFELPEAMENHDSLFRFLHSDGGFSRLKSDLEKLMSRRQNGSRNFEKNVEMCARKIEMLYPRIFSPS